ncbi:hypothetical protein SLE2022_170010 [Rubroshorea leprosula]
MAPDLVIKLLLIGTHLLVLIQGIKGCFEEERSALLEFKAFVKSDGHDADYLLPSWVNDPNDDCCKWERVVCNSTTGRAVNLSLDNIRQFDLHSPSLYHEKNIWYLNTTLFHPFKELRSLNLCGNGIAGWIPDEESLVFQNLSVLDLQFNNVSGPPPSAAQVQATREAVSSYLPLPESIYDVKKCEENIAIQSPCNDMCCRDECIKKYKLSADQIDSLLATFDIMNHICYCDFLSTDSCPTTTVELLSELADLVRNA